MPEMENLHVVRIFVDSVENDDGRVNDLPDAGAAGDNRTNGGEPSKQLDVIEDIVPKTLRGTREVDPGVFDDLREIG